MDADFLIIGGGIAGASAGYHLATHGRVLLLEMEPVAGYHATGRSAALFSEYYGGPVVRALTSASRSFLDDPPPGFGTTGLLTPRGVLALSPAGEDASFDAALADELAAPTPAREIDLAEVARYCPIIRPDRYHRAMVRPAAQDIDVDALHQGFLRGIRAAGGQIVRSARVRTLVRVTGGWRAETDAGHFTGGLVVNAAGAWADQVAELAGVRPVGLTPLRRTAFLVDLPDGVSAARWPMVSDVAETFYFKPESGRLLISPADATPTPPGDVRPDDLDVAVGAARVEEATTLRIRRVHHAWAGLRTSAADDVPVVGRSADAEGFLWLAGLGGYGMQVAPSLGRLLAALVTGATPPESGVDPAQVAPDRFH